MKITVTRTDYTTTSTISDLAVNGIKVGYTLEDVVRPKEGKKVYGATAIPAGTYAVVPHDSPKFGKIMPMLQNVPGYQYVLLHQGNTNKDSEGCLLVGSTKSKDFVGSSRVMFDKLYPQIVAAWNKNETVTITIIDTKPSPLSKPEK